MYATVYTRRGSPQHNHFLDAYIDHGKYVALSGALYLILGVEWIHDANAFRWEVRRARPMGRA